MGEWGWHGFNKVCTVDIPKINDDTALGSHIPRNDCQDGGHIGQTCIDVDMPTGAGHTMCVGGRAGSVSADLINDSTIATSKCTGDATEPREDAHTAHTQSAGKPDTTCTSPTAAAHGATRVRGDGWPSHPAARAPPTREVGVGCCQRRP